MMFRNSAITNFQLDRDEKIFLINFSASNDVRMKFQAHVEEQTILNFSSIESFTRLALFVFQQIQIIPTVTKPNSKFHQGNYREFSPDGSCYRFSYVFSRMTKSPTQNQWLSWKNSNLSIWLHITRLILLFVIPTSITSIYRRQSGITGDQHAQQFDFLWWCLELCK